jgi:hypothetical protein
VFSGIRQKVKTYFLPVQSAKKDKRSSSFFGVKATKPRWQAAKVYVKNIRPKVKIYFWPGVQLKVENVIAITQGVDIAVNLGPEFFEGLEVKAKHKEAYQNKLYIF